MKNNYIFSKRSVVLELCSRQESGEQTDKQADRDKYTQTRQTLTSISFPGVHPDRVNISIQILPPIVT